MEELTKKQLYRYAFALAIFTVVYNMIEGVFATYFGFEDEAFSLFGFGIDSFIEVISGVGIIHMVLRIRQDADSKRDDYERTALRITGTSFYILASGLTFTAIYTILAQHQPETTYWGVIVSLASILVMWLLINLKIRVGTALNSEAIIADANCTKICFQMSVILLIASGLYEWLHIGYIDSVASLVFAYFSFREGKECFQKAKSEQLCSC